MTDKPDSPGRAAVLGSLEKARAFFEATGNEEMMEEMCQAMDVMTGFVSPHLVLIPAAPSLAMLSRDERGLLLYFETRLVDHDGWVDNRSMNAADRAIAKRWAEEGLIQYGRTPWRIIEQRATSHAKARYETTWVRFTAQAWSLAQQERRERSARMLEKLDLNDPTTV